MSGQVGLGRLRSRGALALAAASLSISVRVAHAQGAAAPNLSIDAGGVPLEMVLIRAGHFVQGSPDTFEDARSFAGWLANKTGRSFGLPSEGQWEYAYRAGTRTRFYTGDAESSVAALGWFKQNSGQGTHSVAQKQANRFGLFDKLADPREFLDSLDVFALVAEPAGCPNAPVIVHQLAFARDEIFAPRVPRKH